LIGTIKRQAKDLMDELNRVDWPAKQQVLSSTWSTVAISIFVGFFLWACDWVLSKGVGFIIPGGH